MSDAGTNLTLVVGYDGSDGSRRALARVRELDIDYRALVIVAVAPEIRSAGMGVDLAGPPVDTERLLGEARELLAGCERGAIQTRAALGDPAIVLTDIAREVDAQLVIVGRRGGDFVRRTLLGSVAERVVQAAPCDVLVVA
ncbi:MAG: universal stress protein [Solirubrobacteraceae bacterium]